MTPPITVRDGLPQDAPQAAAILLERFDFRKTRAEDYVAEKIRKDEALLAEADGAVAGVLTYRDRFRGNNIYIEEIAVDRRRRRQGIGTALVNELIQRGADYYRMAILLESEQSNKDAHGFFESCGFTHKGAVEDFTKIQEPMVVYKRDI